MSQILVKAAEVVGDSELEMQAKITPYQEQLQAVFHTMQMSDDEQKEDKELLSSCTQYEKEAFPPIPESKAAEMAEILNTRLAVTMEAGHVLKSLATEMYPLTEHAVSSSV
jgi:hypothetical protein